MGVKKIVNKKPLVDNLIDKEVETLLAKDSSTAKYFDDDDLFNNEPSINIVNPDPQNQLACYEELKNPPPEGSHNYKLQVAEEIKLALGGFSSKNLYWASDVAARLATYPCGLEEQGYTLSWELPIEDFTARLLLQDIRTHLKWVFGEHFIVRPVDKLSDKACNWEFDI